MYKSINKELLKALDCLRKNQNLKTLDIRLNPVSANDADYRLFLIHILPNLVKLDDRGATDGERKAALTHFGPLCDDSASKLCDLRPQLVEDEGVAASTSRLNHVNSLAKAPHVLNTQDTPISDLVFASEMIDSQTPPLTGSKAVHPSVIDYSFDAICHLESISNGNSQYSEKNSISSDQKSFGSHNKCVANTTLEKNYPNLIRCHRENGVQLPVKKKAASPHNYDDNVYTSYKCDPIFTAPPPPQQIDSTSDRVRLQRATLTPAPSSRGCSPSIPDGSAISHDTVVDEVSLLVDKYWNGANSMKKNEKFKAYFKNLILEMQFSPNNNNNNSNNNNHFDEEDLSILRIKKIQLEKQVAKLGNFSNTDPVEIVRLTEENRLLQASVENLTQSLKTSQQLQHMVEIVQESHRSLSQTNEHLLSQLASEKLRSDAEIRQLHWSYEQLKRNVGFIAPPKTNG